MSGKFSPAQKEVVMYAVFGVLTTVINFAVYFVCLNVFQIDYRFSTAIAWILSVLFAFITNKLYVFSSKEFDFPTLVKEALSFTGFRLASFAIDLGLMILLVELIRVNDTFSKIAVNIVVIVLNYTVSKLFVFKTKKETSTSTD
ncbi:GtrA family protein [Metabacillus sp. 84]|uniref:GtrA family protein n=1 Tax=unclassified Metabacillus TaxID=2675274 RepID=UPI003CEAAF93